MGGHWRAVPGVWPAHIHRPGLVHWYVFAASPAPRLPLATIPCIPRQRTRQPVLTFAQVAYSLGIYLLNLFLAFLSPKFDPALEQDEGMEDGTAGDLPTKEEEFRPFVRRLPEFKFWYSTTKAIAIGFCCSWFEIFNLPVFWPVLVVYWLILFSLTSEFCAISKSLTEIPILTMTSATTNPAYDQIPLCALYSWQDAIPGVCPLSAFILG